MTSLENLAQAALELDRVLLSNIGLGDDWPIQLSCDDDMFDDMIKAINDFGDAVKAYKHEQRHLPQAG